jgi:hypothetical protein
MEGGLQYIWESVKTSLIEINDSQIDSVNLLNWQTILEIQFNSILMYIKISRSKNKSN